MLVELLSRLKPEISEGVSQGDTPSPGTELPASGRGGPVLCCTTPESALGNPGSLTAALCSSQPSHTKAETHDLGTSLPWNIPPACFGGLVSQLEMANPPSFPPPLLLLWPELSNIKPD